MLLFGNPTSLYREGELALGIEVDVLELGFGRMESAAGGLAFTEPAFCLFISRIHRAGAQILRYTLYRRSASDNLPCVK